MNALSQWNQLNEPEDLQQSLGSLFSRTCVDWPEQPPREPQRIPPVAVRENARGCLLKAELAGVNEEDVKLTREDGTLAMTGDRTFDLNRKKDHPAGHGYGRFGYSFDVPADARPARVNAVLEDGVLTVQLDKNSVPLSPPALVSCSFLGAGTPVVAAVQSSPDLLARVGAWHHGGINE